MELRSVLLLASLCPALALAEGKPAPTRLSDEQIAAERKAAIARRHAGPAPKEVAPKAQSAQEIWRELLEGNQRFVSGKAKARNMAKLRGSLVAGQHPKVAVLGCADSRVGPELVFDQGLGDLFVVRTAGEVADAIALASLEYAVEHLHVQAVVVLGHDSCGAVSAAAAGEEPGSENLKQLVGRIKPALAAVKAGSKEEMLAQGVELNAQASARELLERSPVLREHAEKGKLTIFKAVYHLGSGEVVALK